MIDVSIVEKTFGSACVEIDERIVLRCVVPREACALQAHVFGCTKDADRVWIDTKRGTKITHYASRIVIQRLPTSAAELSRILSFCYAIDARAQPSYRFALTVRGWFDMMSTTDFVRALERSDDALRVTTTSGARYATIRILVALTEDNTSSMMLQCQRVVDAMVLLDKFRVPTCPLVACYYVVIAFVLALLV